MKKEEIVNLKNFLIVCFILMILFGFFSLFKTEDSNLTGRFVKLITGNPTKRQGPIVGNRFCMTCGTYERPNGEIIRVPGFDPVYRDDVKKFANDNLIDVGFVSRKMGEITMCSDCTFGGETTLGCKRCREAIIKSWDNMNK